MNLPTREPELFSALRITGDNYDMRGVLRLSIFNPCTWDIFHRQWGHVRHMRVRGARFMFGDSHFEIRDYTSCKMLHEGAWRETFFSDLNKYLGGTIIASQAVHDAEGNVLCVIFPRTKPLFGRWHATVLYPSRVDLGNPNTPIVVGWRDRLNPIFNHVGLNDVTATQEGRDVSLRTNGVTIDQCKEYL